MSAATPAESEAMRLEHFEMIDEVRSVDLAAGRIRVQARVPVASPVFEGQLPGHPPMPHALLTETMVQASNYLILVHLNYARMPFLIAVDYARFYLTVRPGSEFIVEATLIFQGGSYAVTKATLRRDGEMACEAEFGFQIRPFPPGLEEKLRQRAGEIGLTSALTDDADLNPQQLLQEAVASAC